MTFNVEKCNDLLTKSLQPTILRVFFFLALNQHEKTGFVRISKKNLAKILNIDAKSLYSALQWLIKNFIVHQKRCRGYFEFMVSPHYVQWGSDHKARLSLWNQRWADSWKNKKAT